MPQPTCGHTPPESNPVAVIGMACRFPGADSVAALWTLLRDGVDTTSEIPAFRRDGASSCPVELLPENCSSRRAGYLRDEVALFDARFFGLPETEATMLDPQQRLLMLTAWEALEDAGVPPERLRGSRAGVYVGASYTDYADLAIRHGMSPGDPTAIRNFRSMLSGRLSYLFDLRGPSICLDTACSSSLVAVHLACQSLRAGETTLALAAGVSLKLVPDRDIMFSRAGVVAPDGRSKFGDAAADGAGFSEGVGVVVLKPLQRALADGDRLHAVILGSAVGNDGASSGELLTPSVEGQVEMLRQAYDNARVDPADVDFVEAHGNGTPTMDPIEFAGLNEVLGKNRADDHRCFVGSIKTNIGHTESAAGIAGLIKTALCLRHGRVVPSLHFHTPSPDVAWEEIPFTVPTEAHALPDRGRPAIAGVSGQGLSAVNAHLVVGQADPAWQPSREPPVTGRPHVLPLSARTREALTDLAKEYVRFLLPGGQGDELELRDICYSAAIRRQHLPHRLAIVADDRSALVSSLRSHLSGTEVAGVFVGLAPFSHQPDDAGTGQHEQPRANDSRRWRNATDLARRYVEGNPVRWTVVTDPGARFVDVPTYPWRLKRHWLDTTTGHRRAAESVTWETMPNGTAQHGEPESEVTTAPHIDGEVSDDDLDQLLLIRRFEERLLRLFSDGLLAGTTHTCIGQEYIPVAIAPLVRRDFVFSNHRGHGHYLAHCRDPEGLLAELLGREGAVCRGVGGSQHLRRDNFVSTGVQGESVPAAVGVALHFRHVDKPRLTMAYIGDGTWGEGAVYEGLNMARLWSVPLLLVVEHNGIAQSTRTDQQMAGTIADRARAFGIGCDELRGTDVADIRRRLEPVVRRVRVERMPHVVVFHTDRLGPHSKGDDTRQETELEELHARDWLSSYATRFPERVQAADHRARARIEAAVDDVLARPPSVWTSE